VHDAPAGLHEPAPHVNTVGGLGCPTHVPPLQHGSVHAWPVTAHGVPGLQTPSVQNSWPQQPFTGEHACPALPHGVSTWQMESRPQRKSPQHSSPEKQLPPSGVHGTQVPLVESQ
jgi:hypothetical protein